MTKFAAYTARAVLAVAAASALGAAANAQPLSTRIAVSDLNFARSVDVARFEQRLQAAGDERCSPQRHSKVVVAACRTELRREALAQLTSTQARQMASAKTADTAYALARR